MRELPYTIEAGAVLLTPHIIGSNIGPAKVIGTGSIKSENFLSGSAGWSIDGDGNVEFNDGNFRGDVTGATGTFSGAISGSTIDIGGSDSSSFHVDASGNMWLGYGTYGSSAPFRVSSGGVVVATDITITGGSQNINSGTWQVSTAGDVVVDGTMTVTGNIDLDGTGYFRTNTSGRRIEILDDSSYALIRSYTGHASESSAGYLWWTHDSTNDRYTIALNTPSRSGRDNALIEVNAQGSSKVAEILLRADLVKFIDTDGDTVLEVTGNISDSLSIGPWVADSSYAAFSTVASTVGYMVLTEGTNTFISTPAYSGAVYIRPDANGSTRQIWNDENNITMDLPVKGIGTYYAMEMSSTYTIHYNSSTAREKRDFVPLTPSIGVDRLRLLEPVSFIRNVSDEEIAEFKAARPVELADLLVREKGFTAEQVAAVDPTLAVWDWDRAWDETTREYVIVPGSEFRPRGLNWWGIVTELVCAVQQLHTDVEALKGGKP